MLQFRKQKKDWGPNPFEGLDEFLLNLDKNHRRKKFAVDELTKILKSIFDREPDPEIKALIDSFDMVELGDTASQIEIALKDESAKDLFIRVEQDEVYFGILSGSKTATLDGTPRLTYEDALNLMTLAAQTLPIPKDGDELELDGTDEEKALLWQAAQEVGIAGYITNYTPPKSGPETQPEPALFTENIADPFTKPVTKPVAKPEKQTSTEPPEILQLESGPLAEKFLELAAYAGTNESTVPNPALIPEVIQDVSSGQDRTHDSRRHFTAKLIRELQEDINSNMSDLEILDLDMKTREKFETEVINAHWIIDFLKEQDYSDEELQTAWDIYNVAGNSTKKAFEFLLNARSLDPEDYDVGPLLDEEESPLDSFRPGASPPKPSM